MTVQQKSGTYTGKRGFALVEMIIAMALLAIVSTMIVSFSTIAQSKAESQKSRYDFLEETSQIRQALSTWLSQIDEETTVCTVADDSLSVNAYGASSTFERESFVLTHRNGAVSRVETKSVTSVEFTRKVLSEGNAIVKCTVVGGHDRNEPYEQTFLLFLRCGSFAE